MQATEDRLRSNPAVQRITVITKATGQVKIIDVSTLRPRRIVRQSRLRAIMLTISVLILVAGAVLLRFV